MKYILRLISILIIKLLQKKVRIIKRIMPDGRVEFTIQQRHFLFFWWWVDAWVNNTD